MRKLVRFLLWTAIIVGAIIGVARYTAIRWWRVPENDPYLEASISPSLRGGDLIILWRLTAPSFGDLVLCPEPEAPERVVIGRIAGESNDKVRLEGGQVQTNRSVAPTERACGKFLATNPSTGREIEQDCDIEVLGGRGHMRGRAIIRDGQKPKLIERKVKEDTVFLLSDNRQFPYDSRDFGFVERATCKETVVFRLVSKAGFNDEESRMVFIH